MKGKHISPLLGQILKKIAPKIGAKVVLEPKWQVVGQVVFKSGKKRYFRYSSLDLNPLGAAEVSRDKDYANFFMRKMGYPVIRGKAFYSPEWSKAIGSKKQSIPAAADFAQKLGYPLIAKPNSGSQGVGVFLVYNKKELERALKFIFKKDRVALLQQRVHGTDCRVVVLDGKVISAYVREPLSVVGNGRSNISQLLRRKSHDFVASSRDSRIRFNDPRIKAKLAHQKLSLRSVPAKGKRVFLLDNANLSSGGDAIDVTNTLHSSYKKLSIKLTKDMGLRLCGVDLMIEENLQKAGKCWILETNAAPGLDHYVKVGRAQQKIVEQLYLQVLKSMKK